jgi:hypothetical protein
MRTCVARRFRKMNRSPRNGLTAAQVVALLASDGHQARRATIVQWLASCDDNGLPKTRSLGNKHRAARDRVVNRHQLALRDDRWLVLPVVPVAHSHSRAVSVAATARSKKPSLELRYRDPETSGVRDQVLTPAEAKTAEAREAVALRVHRTADVHLLADETKTSVAAVCRV